MTTIELEARKAMLVKEILTDINSEEMLDKLAGYLKRLKKTAAGSQAAPCQYTRDEMASILLEREKDTHVYTHEQVKNEMKNLIASWK
jgi:hypothetical protein